MKKIAILILCLFLLCSVAFMTACNKEDSDKELNNEIKVEQNDTTKDADVSSGPETVAPIDTANIEPAKGGDIVGEWLSDTISLEMGEGMVANYNTRFIFREDGMLTYSLSLYGDGKIYEAAYEVDGGNIIFGEGINLSNVTFTVVGDILLLNSDELNVAFRRQ